jgi:superfamily I DNA/RNA helicase
MLDILKQQKALVILVGDDAQQIYEWRGAVNAMEQGEWPQSSRLYLTQSFRFGKAVADVANSILEKVGTPLRLRGLESIPSRVEACPEPTAILCRTNAVAVGSVLKAIKEGKAPHLVGGGSDVVAFVKAAQELQQGSSTSHPELACFRSWAEVEEYSKLDEGEDLKLMVKLINGFGCAAILGALQNMPKEDKADVVVCTAHKSKGREWHSVKLANDFPTLSKACDADLKLLYVAATRAKVILDITECPFFTGEDALEIIPHAPESPTMLPPAPATPPVTDYSWSKDKNGNWRIRGPKGHSGETVKVVRRDGSESQVTLGKVSWENDQVAVYEFTRGR